MYLSLLHSTLASQENRAQTGAALSGWRRRAPVGGKWFKSVDLLAVDGEGWNRASLRRQHTLNKVQKIPGMCISKEQCDRQWEQHV